MRLYEARLVLRSPAIITLRRTERGYVKPPSFIPGSTLRGALVTALGREGLLSQEDFSREASEPRILASAAMPVVGGRRTLPATPFMARCKVCGHTVDLTEGAARALEGGGPLEFPALCPSCGERGSPSPLEPLHGEPVYLEGRLRAFRPRSFRATSVGISKVRGAAVKELLFDYEAIAEGTEFWAWVAAEGLELPGRLEVSVGRGRSRGFGWAELTLTPAQAQPAPERGVFVALSPLLPVGALSWGGSTIKLERVVGRTLRTQLGWDMRANEPRPFATLARPGSLAVAAPRCDPAALRAGLPASVGGSLVVGLNALIPLEEYYRLLRGG